VGIANEGLTPSANAAITTLPPASIRTHELENGLNLVVQSDFSAPVVSIQYWVATGSIHENRFLGSGISHFLEHMMFKGTPTRGNSAMAQQIHDLGGHLNAYTSFDRTVYHVDLPAEGWRSALEILSDSMLHSTLPADEFDKEQEVIRREFAMGQDNPDRELGRLLFRTAYTKHPYRFPVIGLLDLYNQITRDDLLSYYHERYTVQNLTLIVCGAVTAEEVFAEAEKLCSHVPRHRLEDVYVPNEPAQQAPRTAFLPFPTELSRLAVTFAIPGLNHEDIPALDVLSILIGNGRSSRLNLSCVEKSGLAEDIEAFTFAPIQTGLWGIEARYAPGKHAALLEEIHRQLEQIKAETPSHNEIDRARRLSLLQQLHSMKTMSGKAASLGRGWLANRDPLFSAHYLERLQTVTPEDVTRVAREYLLDQTRTLVEIAPATASSSTVATSPITPQPPAVKPLSLGHNIHGLSLATDTLPLVALRTALGKGGLLHEPKGLAGINRLAAQLLTKGTRRRTAEQLALDVEALGGSLSSDSGNNSAMIGIELLSQDWKRGTEILLEILTEPAFSENELQTEKRKQLANIKNENDHPMALVRNLVRETLYPGHPYANPTLGTENSVQTITLADIERYSRAHLLNQSLILTVAGPVDSSAFEQTTRDTLGQLPAASAALSSIPSPYRLLTEPVRVEKIVEKEQAVIQIAFPTAPLTHPDLLLLSVIEEALSDLGSRLFIKIREELGLAYFVGASQYLALAGGYFFFYVGTDPKKRALIEEALLKEIAVIAQSGLTETELNRARSKMLSQEKIEAQNPSHVIYGAALDEMFGLGYDYNAKRQQRLKNLSLDEINAAAKKYFTVPGCVIATVSPQ
jgi:zinc protease